MKKIKESLLSPLFLFLVIGMNFSALPYSPFNTDAYMSQGKGESFLSPIEAMESTPSWWEGKSYGEMAEDLERLSSVEAAERFKELAEYSLRVAAEVLKLMDKNSAASMLLAKKNDSFILDRSLRVDVLYSLVKLSPYKEGEILEEMVKIDAEETAEMIKENSKLLTKLSSYQAGDILTSFKPEKAAEIIETMSEREAAEILSTLSSSKIVNILMAKDSDNNNNNYEILRRKRTDILYYLIKINPFLGGEVVEEILVGADQEIQKEGVKMIEEEPRLITRIPTYKAAEILESVDKKKAAEIVSVLSSREAVEIFSMLEAEIVAGIIMAKDKDTTTYILSRQERTNLLSKLVKTRPHLASEVLLEILKDQDQDNAEEVVEMIKQTPQILTYLPFYRAAEVFGKIANISSTGGEKTGAKLAAQIVEVLSFRRSAEIIKNSFDLRHINASDLISIFTAQDNNNNNSGDNNSGEYLLQRYERSGVLKKLISLGRQELVKDTLVGMLSSHTHETVEMIKEDTPVLTHLSGAWGGEVLTTLSENTQRAEIVNAIGPTNLCYRVMVGIRDDSDIANIFFAKEDSSSQWILSRLFRVNMLTKFHNGLTSWRAGKILENMFPLDTDEDEENSEEEKKRKEEKRKEVREMILVSPSIIMFLENTYTEDTNDVDSATIFNSFTNRCDQATVVNGLGSEDGSKLLNGFYQLMDSQGNSTSGAKIIGEIFNWMSVGKENIDIWEEDYSSTVNEILVELIRNCVVEMLSEYFDSDTGIVIARNYIKNEDESQKVALTLEDVKEKKGKDNFLNSNFFKGLCDPEKNKEVELSKFASVMDSSRKGVNGLSYFLSIEVAAAFLENLCANYVDEETSLSENVAYFFQKLSAERAANVTEKAIENNSLFINYSASAFKTMVGENTKKILDILKEFHSPSLAGEILTAENEESENILTKADLLTILDEAEFSYAIDLIDEIYAYDSEMGDELNYFFENVELLQNYLENGRFSDAANLMNNTIYQSTVESDGLETVTGVLGLLETKTAAACLLSLQGNGFSDLAEDLIYYLDNLSLLDKEWRDICEIIEEMDDVGSAPEYFNGSIDGYTYAGDILKDIAGEKEKEEDIIKIFEVISVEDGGEILDRIQQSSGGGSIAADHIFFGIVDLDNNLETDEMQAAKLLMKMQNSSSSPPSYTQAVSFVGSVVMRDPSGAITEDFQKLAAIFAYTTKEDDDDRAAEILYQLCSNGNADQAKGILLYSTDYKPERSASMLVSLYKLDKNATPATTTYTINILDNISTDSSEFDRLVRLFKEIEETDKEDKINYGGHILYDLYNDPDDIGTNNTDLIRNLILDKAMGLNRACELFTATGKAGGETNGPQALANIFSNYDYGANGETGKFKRLVDIFEHIHYDDAARILSAMNVTFTTGADCIIDEMVQRGNYSHVGNIFASENINSKSIAEILNAVIASHLDTACIEDYAEVLKQVISAVEKDNSTGNVETKLYNIDSEFNTLSAKKAQKLEDKVLEMWREENSAIVNRFDYDNDGIFDLPDDANFLREDLNGDGSIDGGDRNILRAIYKYPYLQQTVPGGIGRDDLMSYPSIVDTLEEAISIWEED